ncbi:MAG: 50S ribosomal protein L30 [Armatimonadetes bacterium]|nr:50S ribosomal protein L30 [Armatimonadota bacterium]
MGRVRITLRRSLHGRPAQQQAILRTLGLRRIGQTVERPRSPRLAGMLRRVTHLVDVDDGNGQAGGTR